MMGKANAFDILKIMGEREMEIKMAPLKNIKRSQTGKNGYGEVVIAVDNDTIMDLMLGKGLVGGFVVANADQFEAIKAELERE